jgi:hypothetical protein
LRIILQLNAVLLADPVEAAAIPMPTYEHKNTEENDEWVHLRISKYRLKLVAATYLV